MKIGIGIGTEFSRTFGSSYVGILDTYSGATSGYSLRKLKGSYSGYAARIRRSGDNSESDFGFDANGDFNWASCSAFIVAGGGTQIGYIVKLYDQSGNGYDLSQTTAGLQFRIQASSSLTTRPNILGASGNYLTSLAPINNTALSFYAPIYGTNANNAAILSNNDANSYQLLEGFSDGLLYWGNGGSGHVNVAPGFTILNTVNAPAIICRSSSDRKVFNKGVQTATSATSKSASGTLRVGANYGSMIGSFCEILLYPTGHDNTTVAAITSNQMTYYGIV